LGSSEFSSVSLGPFSLPPSLSLCSAERDLNHSRERERERERERRRRRRTRKEERRELEMDLDHWISKVKEGQHLLEDELQLLCEYVRIFPQI
jgi:hypothetical protein